MPQRLAEPLRSVLQGKPRISNSTRHPPTFEQKRKRHWSHLLSVSLSIGLLITGLATSGKTTKLQEREHPSTSRRVKPEKLRAFSNATSTLSLRRAHSEVLLNRSDTWYLYHRFPTMTSAAYIARGPTPSDRNAPEWKLYSTWLLRLLESEAAQVSTIGLPSFSQHTQPESRPGKPAYRALGDNSSANPPAMISRALCFVEA